MTLEEILKANGVSDEAAQAIRAAMREGGIYTASEENLDVRYGKLKTQHDALKQQLTQANTTIEDLKKSTNGQEDAQQKIAAYEAKITELETKLARAQIEADAHVELLAAGFKPEDMDYVMYKLEAKGALERGEDGKIKGLDDKIAELKTQLPASLVGKGEKKIIERTLPDNPAGGEPEPKDLADALRQRYEPKND